MKLHLIIYSALAVALTACSGVEPVGSDSETHTAHLILDAERPTFDGQESRSDYDWGDGWIYLQLSDAGGTFAKGCAHYDIDQWNVSWTGSLTLNTPMQAKVYWFENALGDSGFCDLTPEAITYCDEGAIYIYDGQTVKLQASLTPAVSGLRFRTDAAHHNEPVIVKAMPYYTHYTMSSASFEYNKNYDIALSLSEQVGDKYYSPYFYVPEWNTELHLINEDTEYVRDISSLSIMEHGKRGFMDIPTPTSHAGWEAIPLEGDVVQEGRPGSEATFWPPLNLTGPAYILKLEFLIWEPAEDMETHFGLSFDGGSRIDLFDISEKELQESQRVKYFIIPPGFMYQYGYNSLDFSVSGFPDGTLSTRCTLYYFNK